MKQVLIIHLLLISHMCLGQYNYYTQNVGLPLQTEKEFKNICETHLRKPSSEFEKRFNLKPLIYHKENRNDSVINYYNFQHQPNDTIQISFIQDSMFLLLNKKFPFLNLNDINGTAFKLDTFEGKPTLINFTATYCKACLTEIPKLNKLKNKYDDKVNFIAIFDVEKNAGDIEGVIEKYPFDFIILKNTESLKKQLGINSLPYNVFIDKYGYVRNIQRIYNYHLGDSDDNYFIRLLNGMLNE